jgi:DNA repair exonuclease SbcCD ATPase subunit
VNMLSQQRQPVIV